MIDAFLKEVIVYVAGKPAEPLADILSTKIYVNEFLVAKKMNLVINQTRNLLYKLSDSGIVSSIRKKDKKKGWFTYFWKIETLKSLEFLSQILSKQIEQINSQLKTRESKQFYICDTCNIELTGEKALLYDFTCNECGEIFKIKDNSKLIKELKKNLEKLNNKLTSVNSEIQKEKEKAGKQRAVENKKLAKEVKKKTPPKKDQKKKTLLSVGGLKKQPVKEKSGKKTKKVKRK